MPDSFKGDFATSPDILIPQHVYYHIPQRFLPLVYTLPSLSTLLPENVDIQNKFDPSLVEISILNQGYWKFRNEFDTSILHTSGQGTFAYESLVIPGQQSKQFDAVFQGRQKLLGKFLSEVSGQKQDDICIYRAPTAMEWGDLQRDGYYIVLERTNFENQELFGSDRSQVKVYYSQTDAKDWDSIRYAGIILKAKVDPRLYIGVPGTVPRFQNRYPHFITSEQIEYSDDGGKTFKGFASTP